jgi:hypothetical protein
MTDMAGIADTERALTSELGPSGANKPKKPKTGGRQKGVPNRVTREVREALRDLADGNADRVQEWLDRVAEDDPAEAIRLYLGLCRYVVPVLSAAAVADITPKPAREELAALSDRELLELVAGSPEAIEIYRKGMAMPIAAPDRYLPKPDPTDKEILK